MLHPATKVERTIRSKLVSYLAKEMSLRAFWRWFVPAVWDIDHTASPRLRELVYEIKRHVDNYSSSERISEEHLRAKLLPLASSVTVGEDPPQNQEPRSVAGTASPIYYEAFSLPPRPRPGASYKKCEVASG